MSIPLKFFTIVRPNECKLVERFGRFNRRLDAGLHLLVPLVDNVAHSLSYKEVTKEVPQQSVITKDNIDLRIACLLYYRVVDGYKAAYNNMNSEKAIEIMAQSLLRCEIGKLTLDSILHERQRLNSVLSEEIKATADRWGIECYRYEITNIDIEEIFAKTMNFEAESERHKRKLFLNASAFEVTALNNARRDKAIAINEKTAEGKALYYQYKVVAEKLKMLRALLERGDARLDQMELKLKQDLAAAYAELAAADKSVFLRRDLTDLDGVFRDIDDNLRAPRAEATD